MDPENSASYSHDPPSGSYTELNDSFNSNITFHNIFDNVKGDDPHPTPP
jgi:hypothetical protein